jgi:aryl-alcohol dehydrogenase-like predicted oxidoreductase
MRLELKPLGNNGPMVSAIGLGCMGMSDMYGSTETRNDASSIETIRSALDSGINFLDTGDYYGAGHNELLIREALRNLTEKPVICVKFGALRSNKVSILQSLADKKGCTASQLAIAWVLHKGSDILPLTGTTSKERLAENIQAINIRLSAADLLEIDNHFPEGSFSGTRYAEQQMGTVVN